MGSVWFLLSGVIFFGSVWAAEVSQYVLEDKKNSVINEQRNAVVEYVADEHMACSMVIVSNSCHALTDGHCLKLFLEKNKLLKYVSVDDGRHSKFGISDPSKTKGLEIPINSRFKKMNATLLHVGNGLSKASETPVGDWYKYNPDANQPAIASYQEYNKYIKDTRYGPLADYALIKLPQDSCSCVTTGNVNPDGSVIMVGYPDNDFSSQQIKKENPDAKISSSVALGQMCVPQNSNIRNEINQSAQPVRFILKALFENHFLKSDEFLREEAETFKDEIIYHTARSGQGASGGALFNSSFELVGLNLAVSSFDKSPDPFSTALRTEYIKKELQKNLTAEEFQEAFRCDPKK